MSKQKSPVETAPKVKVPGHLEGLQKVVGIRKTREGWQAYTMTVEDGITTRLDLGIPNLRPIALDELKIRVVNEFYNMDT